MGVFLARYKNTKKEKTKTPQNSHSPGPLTANNKTNSSVMKAFVLSP